MPKTTYPPKKPKEVNKTFFRTGVNKGKITNKKNA